MLARSDVEIHTSGPLSVVFYRRAVVGVAIKIAEGGTGRANDAIVVDFDPEFESLFKSGSIEE